MTALWNIENLFSRASFQMAKQTMSEQFSAEQPVRLESLTVLRFFAAILVVAHHYCLLGVPAAPDWLTNILHNGPQAVTFFFILSGFVLGYSHFGTRKEGLLRPRNFWAARFARIYPLYLAALVLSLPFFLYGYLSAVKISSLKFGLSLLLVPILAQSWLPMTALAWNSPAWSLSVEAFFYLIFPFVINRFAGKFEARSFIALLIFASVFEFCRLCCLGISEEGSLFRHFISYFPLLHVPKFLLGIMLAKCFVACYRSGFLFRNSIKLTWVALAAVISLLSIPPNFQCLVGALLIIAFCMLTLSAAFIHKNGFFSLNTRLGIVLGEASYGIYILHVPISMWYSSIMKYLRIANWHMSVFYGSLYFVVVIASSIFLYLKFEAPMRNWLRSVLIKNKSPR